MHASVASWSVLHCSTADPWLTASVSSAGHAKKHGGCAKIRFTVALSVSGITPTVLP
jgi:hypothetical protein